MILSEKERYAERHTRALPELHVRLWIETDKPSYGDYYAPALTSYGMAD
jgi:hypothetical protein